MGKTQHSTLLAATEKVFFSIARRRTVANAGLIIIQHFHYDL